MIEKKSNEMKAFNLTKYLFYIFFFGLILPALGSGISITFFPEWRLVHLPIHSLIEGLGGFIALTFAGILLAVHKRKFENFENLWISFALISMGTLDIFHAGLEPGKLFVWIHSIAHFVGGLFFALVWLPNPIRVNTNVVRLPAIVFAGVVILGLVSLTYPKYMPEMVRQGEFSIFAQALNILGGVGFLLATGFFIKQFYLKRQFRDYLFAIHCTLFGAAGILFEMSQLWDAAWWWWHLLRLMAYSAGLILAIISYRETEEKLWEAKRHAEAAQKEAERANKAKSNFLSNISHEIRTPMNSILGYSQILLRRRDLDSDQRRALDIIDSNGKNLLELLNEVLDISKIEAGKMDLQIDNFDLNSLIDGISKMFELRYRQKQLGWRVEGLKGPCIVSGDENKLRAILINLIGNAIKFTDCGNVEFKIIPLENEQFLFEVIDTGSGIAAKDQQHILEPFYQNDSGVKKGGTGLGLAISQKQLELMGTELKVKSELGKGSCFYFTLHLPKVTDEIFEHSEEEDILCLAEGYSVKALVVEDVKESRDLLGKFLSSLKIDVILAKDGKESLEKVREYLPDIIFMDIRMPILNGKEAIKLIQKEFGKDRFKIVVVTASALKSDVNPYKEMGVKEFISKPFRLEQISCCLRNLLDVEFQYAQEKISCEKLSSIIEPDYSKINLSEELSSQLIEAVELSSITELERVISKLQSMDENCILFAENIEAAMNRYDMRSIVKMIQKINHEGK